MSDQLFRVVGSGTYLADEPDNKGRLRVDGFVVPVEPDHEAMYQHIIDKLDTNVEFTVQDAIDVLETALKGTDDG